MEWHWWCDIELVSARIQSNIYSWGQHSTTATSLQRPVTFFCPGGQSILWLLFKPLYNGHFRLFPRWPLWRWMARDAVESSQQMRSKLFHCFLGLNFQWRNVRIHTTNGPSLWRQKNSPTSRGSFAWSIVLLRKLHGGYRCYRKMDLHRRVGGMLTLHEFSFWWTNLFITYLLLSQLIAVNHNCYKILQLYWLSVAKI